MSLESEERLRILVETSPAAIVTVNERGIVEKHNRAAGELLAPRDGNLLGLPIATFLPQLQHALRPEEGPQFRTSMQCPGQRDNGEAFLADVWFSTYREGVNPKLAAIIADVTEENASSRASSSESVDIERRGALSNREIETLRLVFEGLTNKEVAARLQVPESTVKNTLQQLFAKTHVRTRAQLVRVALEYYRDLL
jgi:PAS domain S-box-containing protein